MHQHRQVMLGRQGVNTHHRLIVGSWRIPGNQCRQVVVTGEDLANALPQPRIEVEHALYVRGGILVIRIKPRQKRMKMPTLLSAKLLDRLRHPHIGCAVPISVSVVTRVVTRALGFVFMPLFGHWNARNHHVLNAIFLHRSQQLRHTGGFLEKIHVMQMRVAVSIFACLHRGTDRQHPQSQKH